MKRWLLILLLLLSGTLAFGQQDVSKQTERKRKIEEEISFIDKQLKSISSKQKATTEQLSLIRKKVSNRKSLISDLDKQIAVIEDAMTDKQREINRLQKELDTLSSYYTRLICSTWAALTSGLTYGSRITCPKLAKKSSYWRSIWWTPALPNQAGE